MSTTEILLVGGGKPWRVSGEGLLGVKANFCNLRDSRGRIIYTPALPGSPEDVFAEWMALQRANGSTHVPFGPPSGGPAYPGIPWPNPDFWSDLPAFRAFVERVLDTPAADGNGFRPIVFLGGDTFAESHIDQWPALARALEGLRQFLTVLVAWEPVVGWWSSRDVSEATLTAAALFPESLLAGHGSPTRWVSSSNPVELDDPWQGAEADFFKSHGGQYLRQWFYQTPHGSDIYTPCTCPSADAKFGHEDRCWLNRFEDGVARLGAGYNGWRKVAVCLYETVAYEAFRGLASSAQARAVARAGQTVAEKWGVTLSFGNGLP